jgi:hypothetical protein
LRNVSVGKFSAMGNAARRLLTFPLSAVNFVNARPSCSGFCVEQSFQVENRLVVAEKTVLYLLDLLVSIQNLYEFVTYLRILGESWGIINFLK